METVSVTFWEKEIDGEIENEIEVLSYSLPFYPSYKIGDVVFLQITEHPYVDQKYKKGELDLTKYTISDVHHSVRQHLSNIPTEDIIDGKKFSIPFSIQTYTYIDIYVIKNND